MHVQCAWCKCDMGEKAPLENKETTHGICEDCYIKELMKMPAADTTTDDRTLFLFQILNCPYCEYADKSKVWTTAPCCRCASMIKVKNRRCQTRKPNNVLNDSATPKK